MPETESSAPNKTRKKIKNHRRCASTKGCDFLSFYGANAPRPRRSEANSRLARQKGDFLSFKELTI